MTPLHARWMVILVALLSAVTGCANRDVADHPRIAAGVTVRDVAFSSRALGREMRYRVALPTSIATGRRLPVVYLLHGADGGYQDWSNHTDVTRYCNRGLILVMPEGRYSYYLNAFIPSGNRYEDYLVQDLVADVEQRFPAAKERCGRAIAGVSMGGFGAVKLAFSHPAMFGFAAGLSPAIDVAHRPFSLRRIGQSQALLAIFGPPASDARRERDPFFIAQSADAAAVPHLYLSCGENEALLAPNREFEALLSRRGISHEFRVLPGGHDWSQWNRQLPNLFSALAIRLGCKDGEIPDSQ